MDILRSINERLNTGEFAKSFNEPLLTDWITSNYDRGYGSRADYNLIVKWYKNKQPVISKYSFHDALINAKKYNESLKNTGVFNNNAEILNFNVEIKFDDGKYWSKIHPDDCNSLVHRMGSDYSKELKAVIDGANGWALFDSQDNLLCILIDNGTDYPIILSKSDDTNDQIYKLCIKKGIQPGHEAYSYNRLIEALMTNELDVDKIHDTKSLLDRLKPQDIIKCRLLHLSHHCKLAKIFDLYKLTGKTCLLEYIYCFMIVHGLTKHELFGMVKSEIANNKQVGNKYKSGSNDTRIFIDYMEEAQLDITRL